MSIGLTYDLKDDYLAMGYSEDESAEFDRKDTIDALETTLQTLGYRTDRIGNAYKLTERLVRGDRWDMVFNIAEGMNGIGREAQVPAILDLYGIPYTFSDPMVMSLTLHKGMTKRVVRDAGIATSAFQVVERAEQASMIPFDPPYFVKPVGEGTSKGVSSESIVRNRRMLPKICRKLIAVYHQPVLVETFLPGREFTIGITGSDEQSEVLGSMEVILLNNAESDVYSYDNKANYQERVEYRLVKGKDDSIVARSEKLAIDAWKALGCRDAGRIDVRCDENDTPQFVEVNPLAGLNPTHSDLPILCSLLGIPYVHLIDRIMQSALQRIRAIDEKMARMCA